MATPKAPGERRRRNKGQAQWKQLPADGPGKAPPDLPGDDWLTSTLEWWMTIWESPMAAMWEKADLDALVRLAVLRDDFHNEDSEISVGTLGEMRQLEDRLGLSPRSRRMLQWEIEKANETAAPATEGARKLRAVEG